MKYLAKLRYVGCDFHGFQVQPNVRTVQGELSVAMEQTLGIPCRVTGCSRTDAGVHALAFCVTIEADGATVPPEKLPIAALPYLPHDLSLYEACEVSKDFHVRYDVHSKQYVYRILNRKVPDPFLVGRVWHLPRRIDEEGLARMRAAAERFVGTHDFTSFMAEGTDVTDTVRTVLSMSVDAHGDQIDIRVRADGFLYHMVRIMVGTLTEVAFGKFEPEDIGQMLDAKDRTRAGMTAPADGLYLEQVFYPMETEEKT
ncbi:MAG: tRNA pseudouridine(38-40) synthase TruA [Clostridia bacterium]|nr:tRNA pseudouridine(38-40) synthase TruA [Clostridia bacterium]